MGIWKDAFVAPVEPVLPSAESFGRLLVDLGRDRIVRMPWALIAGQLDVNSILLWSGGVVAQTWNGAPCGTSLRSDRPDLPSGGSRPWGLGSEHARVLARGDAVLDVLPALASAPYGTMDIAVVFDSLDFGNSALLRHYWSADRRTAVVCYAFAHPQHRWLYADLLLGSPGGPTHEVRVCLVNTFKFGDHEVCSAISDVVSRHLGPALVHGLTMS